MEDQARSYIPAAGHDFALSLYDPLVRLSGGDRIRIRLLEQAALVPGQKVLDIGCGTGTLLVTLKKRHPAVDAVGLDPDPRALSRSRRKAGRAGVVLQLDRGFADALPYVDSTFDVVFSSFMLHHLQVAEKELTLREVRRALRPTGALHLLDFVGRQEGIHGRLQRLFQSTGSLRERVEQEISPLLKGAGFAQVEEVERHSLLGQLVVSYRALPA